jgi:hypothetical protein
MDPEIVTLEHITNIGTSLFGGTPLTQVTPSHYPVSTTSLLASLAAHMHTPSTLLGHPLQTPSSLVASNASTSSPVTSSFVLPSSNPGVNPMTVTQIIQHAPGGTFLLEGNLPMWSSMSSSYGSFLAGGEPLAMLSF